MNRTESRPRQLTPLERIDAVVRRCLPPRLGLMLMDLAEHCSRVSLCPAIEEFLAFTEE